MSTENIIVYSPFTTAETSFLQSLAGQAYVTGDILYYNGTNLVRLGIGSATQVLTVNSGLPSWQPNAAGFADPLTTNGDIIARIAGVTTRLAQGGNGTFLGVSGGALGYYTPAGGTGTVTASGGALTANSVVLGAGTTDTKVVAGIITDGISVLTLGVNTTTIGKVKMFGNTSGDATIQPAAIAGTATVVTLPNASSTLPIFGQQVTFAGPTAARTVTFPDANFTVARTDAANTFTGVQTMTSPSITTSIVTGSSTFSVFDTVATTLTAFNATTTLTVGYSSTAASTTNLSTGAVASATTKTVNIGTAGASGSTTNVNIGSAVASAILGTLSLNFPTILTANNNTTVALWNTLSTTVNFAGAATTLTLGAATGTTTIANATVTLSNATVLNINGASPSIVSSSTATGSVFNTNILTGNIFGAATTLTVGGTPTAAITHNYSTNATAAATTKTVNLGTGAAASSTTNVNIGSSNGGTTTVNSLIISLGGTTGVTTTGSIELGAATDTTITRALAGVLAVEGEVLNGYTTTATAAGTTTLTIASTRTQYFTGSSTQTVKLPTTSVIVGQTYIITNTSTGLVTVQSSGANTIVTLGLNQSAVFTALVATPTTAGNWSYAKMNLSGNNTGKRLLTVTQAATPAMDTDNGDIMQITGLAQAITSMTTSLTGTPNSGDIIEIQITDNATARAITWGASFQATTVALPTTTVISTMLKVLFQWNATASKWDCIAVA